MSKIFKLFLLVSAGIVVAVDIYRFYDILVMLIDNYQDAISLVDKELLFILLRLIGSAMIVMGCLLNVFKVLTKLGILLVVGSVAYLLIEPLIPILTDAVQRQNLINDMPNSILNEGLVLIGFLMILLSQKSPLSRITMAAAFAYLIYVDYETIRVLFEAFDFNAVLADSAKLVIIQSTFILALGVFWPLYYPIK